MKKLILIFTATFTFSNFAFASNCRDNDGDGYYFVSSSATAEFRNKFPTESPCPESELKNYFGAKGGERADCDGFNSQKGKFIIVCGYHEIFG